MRRPGRFAVLLTLCLAVTLTFLTLPIVAIFLDSSPAELIDAASASPGRSMRSG